MNQIDQSRSLAETAPMDESEVNRLAAFFDDKPADEVLAWVIRRFSSRVGLCSSFQAEGCVLIDLAWRLNRNIRVFTLDTGRLPQETYDLMDRIRDRYGIRIDIYLPDAGDIEKMVTEHGNNLFYRSVELRLQCCQLRKVKPLRRALANYDAWITGLRRDQSTSRADTQKISLDESHGGIIKLAPLADWSEEDVWNYIRANNVPYNALYDKGYTSIGCAPCTRAITPGEDHRSGRWWWENGALKECGMHCSLESGNLGRQVTALAK